MSAQLKLAENTTAQTLRELFDSMNPAAAIETVVRRLATPRNPGAPRPRIKYGSDHFLFAVLVVNGTEYAEACTQIGVKPKTAESWRRDLREAGRAYYGRDVDYEYVAAQVIDAELNRLQGRAAPH